MACWLLCSMVLTFCHGGVDALNETDVAFVARVDGSTQHYVVLAPPEFDASKPCDALIALHGHGSDRWQYIRQARDECRATRDVAARHGMLFISPDYRAKTSWMGPKAEADLVQIIEEIRETYPIRDVYLSGGSMGGSSCLTFTALHPELIAGAAAINPTANHLLYGNFQDAIQASFGGTKAEIPEEYKRRSAEYWPERFTMPVAITTGGKDESVPPDSAIRLADTLRKMERDVLLIHRPEEGHRTNYEDTAAALEYVIGKARERKASQ